MLHKSSAANPIQLKILMNNVAYFAYGSLVNRYTRAPHTEARPVRLAGWVRQWRHCIETPNGKVCALTVVPRADSELDGVLVVDHREALAEVDRREVGYRREAISGVLPEAGIADNSVETYIYVSNSESLRWGSEEYPIWLSYLECALAGYIDVWERAGAERFMSSTEGWQTPVLDDRAAPKYPRAVALDKPTQEIIDGLLKEHEIRYIGS